MLAYFFKVFNNHFRKYDDIFSYIYIIREKTNKVNTGFARIIDIFLYDKKSTKFIVLYFIYTLSKFGVI